MTTIVVFEDKNHRYSLEPIEKDSSDSTIENGYWVIEEFKSMFVLDKSFCYRLKFKRFEDYYSIMSENIPNDSLKEEFRQKFLADKRNWRLRRLAESGKVKRAVQTEQDPYVPDCFVPDEEEEKKAWELANVESEDGGEKAKKKSKKN